MESPTVIKFSERIQNAISQPIIETSDSNFFEEKNLLLGSSLVFFQFVTVNKDTTHGHGEGQRKGANS